ncbi:hypothetical protein SIL92_004178 [Salmonella enterica]|nr:hypothetical protein [Salmonella enterica]
MACDLAQPAGTESTALDRQSHHGVFAPAAESGPAPRLAEKRRAGRRETPRLSGMDSKETDVARCALLATGWDRRTPDRPVRYQRLVWNEAKQELMDYLRQWHDSPFTGAEFAGHDPDDVACIVFEWFIRRKAEDKP